MLFEEGCSEPYRKFNPFLGPRCFPWASRHARRVTEQTFLIRCSARYFSLFVEKNSLFRLQGIRPEKPRFSRASCRRGGTFRGKFPVFSRGSGNLAAETRSLRPRSTATQSRVFRLSPETRRMLRKKPRIAPPIGVASLSRDPRKRVSAEECRFLPSLSLRANFGGHTSRVADGPRDQRSIMMCVELRIRCSQPPSRGVSTLSRHSLKRSEEARNCATNWWSFFSLPAFLNQFGRSAEIRRRIAVYLCNLTPERRLQCPVLSRPLSLLGILWGQTRQSRRC